MVQTVADKLASLGNLAAVVLGEIAGDQDVPPAVRVQACVAIIGNLPKVREPGIVEQRLAELEQAVERQQSAQHGRWAS
jgi:hypothetical protein